MRFKDMSHYRDGRKESKVVDTWLNEYKQMVMNEIIYRQSNPESVPSEILDRLYESHDVSEIVADSIIGWLNSPVGRTFISKAFSIEVPKCAEDGTEYTE